MMRRVAEIEAPVDREVRGGRRGGGNVPRHQVADDRQAGDRRADHRLAARLQHQKSSEQHAQQNRHEGGHLDKSVAAEQLVVMQMLGQQAVFDR